MKNKDNYQAYKWQERQENKSDTFKGYVVSRNQPNYLVKISQHKYEIEIYYYDEKDRYNYNPSKPLYKEKRIFYMKLYQTKKIDKLLSNINHPFKHDIITTSYNGDRKIESPPQMRTQVYSGLSMECWDPVCYVNPEELKQYIRTSKLKRILNE